MSNNKLTSEEVEALKKLDFFENDDGEMESQAVRKLIEKVYIDEDYPGSEDRYMYYTYWYDQEDDESDGEGYIENFNRFDDFETVLREISEWR